MRDFLLITAAITAISILDKVFENRLEKESFIVIDILPLSKGQSITGRIILL